MINEDFSSPQHHGRGHTFPGASEPGLRDGGRRRFRDDSDEPRGRGRRHGGPHGEVPFEGPFGPGGPRGGRGGRGFGRPGGWQQADLPPADDAADWFTGRLPEDWFVGTPEVSVDREEITVIGALPTEETVSAATAAGRISRFREESRAERMRIAEEAQTRYGRKVAWGASLGETTTLFSHLSVPVMTRLRQNERQVLDTLVDAGVARSRSEALSWCVKLVGEHTDEWLSGLRAAMSEVEKLRTQGPSL